MSEIPKSSGRLDEALARRIESSSTVKKKNNEVGRPLVGAVAIGLLIFAGNLFIAYPSLPFFNLGKIKLIGLFAISSKAILVLLTNIKVPSMIVYIFGLLWTIAIIICAGGLMRFKDSARSFLVKLCIISIVSNIWFILPIFKVWAMNKKFSLTVFHHVLPFVIMIIYVTYLTRPKVKQRFM